MAKVLFVCKDKGGAQMTIPLVLEVVKNGHDYLIIAEGLAAEMFEREELSLYFKGTVNFGEEPFTLDAVAVLNKQKPDAVVVSAGFPINLEYAFAKAANELAVPLVVIEDYWGVCKNLLGRKPDLMLTTDLYSKNLAQSLFRDTTVEIVGHHELSSRELRVRDPSLVSRLQLPKKGLVCLYIGGGDSTTAELNLLVKCLEKTSNTWWLLPRFHPKWINVASSDGRTYAEVWNKILESFRSRVINTHACREPTDIMYFVDVVAGGFSTLLSTAAYLGKFTVSLTTEETMRDFKKITGLPQVPLVTLGLAHSVNVPTNFSMFFRADRELVDELLKPYNPALAHSHLSRFL